MRLSTKAQYAVRAMVDLALNSAGKPVSLKEISRREEIPLNYLEQLFHRLKKGCIVTSARGPGGGYLLARDSAAIRIGEIISTVEEALTPVSCMDADKGGCRRDIRCVTHNVWHRLGERIRDFLDGITLNDLVEEARAASSPGREAGTP